MNFLQVIQQSLEIFQRAMRRAPLLLFLLQLPLALSELVQESLGIHDAVQPSPWTILIALPVFSITSLFASALTYSAFSQILDNKTVTFNDIWEQIRPKISILLIIAIPIGLLTGIGLVALIIPGLLIMTYFLFVPHLIIEEAPTTLWVYATRSKRLAFSHFFLSLSFVIAMFSFSTLIYLTSEQVGTFLGAWGSSEDSRQLLLVVIRSVFSMISGVLMEGWISSYFLVLRRQK